MELCLLREPDLALHSSIFISQMRIWALRPEFVLVSPKGPRSVPLALGQRGRRRSRPGRLRTRPGRARQRALAATRRTAPEKRKTSFPGCGREARARERGPSDRLGVRSASARESRPAVRGNGGQARARTQCLPPTPRSCPTPRPGRQGVLPSLHPISAGRCEDHRTPQSASAATH